MDDGSEKSTITSEQCRIQSSRTRQSKTNAVKSKIKTQNLRRPKSKLKSNNQEDSLVTDLPCLDSSNECIDLLTEKAIANSGELQTLKHELDCLIGG